MRILRWHLTVYALACVLAWVGITILDNITPLRIEDGPWAVLGWGTLMWFGWALGNQPD